MTNARRLSDSGETMDEADLSVIESCLAMEEELGILPPETTSPSQIDRSRRIAELASMFSETAAAHEAMQAAVQPGWSVQPTAQPGPYYYEQMHPWYDPMGSQFSFDPYPMDLTSLWGASGGEGYNGLNLHPALDPNAWADALPEISTQLEPQQHQGPGEFFSSSGTDRLPRLPPVLLDPLALPSTSTVASEEPDLQLHPYVRLPTLEPGVVPKLMFRCGVFGPIRMSISAYSRFSILRQLFAQKTLNQYEANEVASAVEMLVTKTARRARKKVKQTRPLFAASTLGTYFLVFDYLASAVQVFGGWRELPWWWGDLVSVLDVGYRCITPSKLARESSLFNTKLANGLLTALEIYKSGQRPPAALVVELKRQLFFSKYGPNQFKGSYWDPWREDEVSFSKGESSSP
ncbi:hypothetical protein, conserved [Eimeria praecox]|uniref:Uncharacterized protein n=1 Tax=Eimeria praecox TaxID=51316 RepID=U6GZC7_9EIME|nr:hypothetical protein, conserved [Eimeria praecox]